MISKEKLNFDVTSADTIADSDSVGAFVRAGSDGDLIASQTIAAEEWLNVAAAMFDGSGNALSSTAGALDVNVASGNLSVDLEHTEDSIRLGDGTNFLTSTTVGADIGLDVNLINASIVVTASDLDIRDLTQSDEVTVYQGTDPWVIGDGGGSITVDGTVAISGDVNVTQGTSPWVVSATDLDIRDLTAASDSVAAYLADGAGTALTSTLVGSDQALDINVVQSVDPSTANVAIKTTAKSATSTQSALLGSALANRKFVYVQNLGNRKVFLAEAGAADAAATGLQLSPGSVAEFKFGPSANLDIEAAGGTQDIRILEAS